MIGVCYRGGRDDRVSDIFLRTYLLIQNFCVSLPLPTDLS